MQLLSDKTDLEFELKKRMDLIRDSIKSKNDTLNTLIIESLIENNVDIRKIYSKLEKSYKIDDILRVIKPIASMRLRSMTLADSYDEKTKKIKTDILDYLGRYLIKRRAIYLYVYILFIRHSLIINRILKLLNKEVHTTILNDNLDDILKNIRNNMLSQISDDDTRNKFTNVFNEMFTAISKNRDAYKEGFINIGDIIQSLDVEMKGYKVLVNDVIPLIVKHEDWNDFGVFNNI